MFHWADNVPQNCSCKCGSKISPNQLFNCKHFISFQSKVPDEVRDHLYCESKSLKIVSYLKALLSCLVDENTLNSCGRNRGDLLLGGLQGTTMITNVRPTDLWNISFIPLTQSKHKNPLSVAKNIKIDK
ncbi:hypothetical protein P9112_004903 [Eukaryota sp. TZLM1-RC]